MSLANFMFGCRHDNPSWPRRDAQGEYQRCLDCGGRLPYDFASMGEIHTGETINRIAELVERCFIGRHTPEERTVASVGGQTR